jgi:hypothetical protein
VLLTGAILEIFLLDFVIALAPFIPVAGLQLFIIGLRPVKLDDRLG